MGEKKDGAKQEPAIIPIDATRILRSDPLGLRRSSSTSNHRAAILSQRGSGHDSA
jgi:hypothetical protein